MSQTEETQPIVAASQQVDQADQNSEVSASHAIELVEPHHSEQEIVKVSDTPQEKISSDKPPNVRRTERQSKLTEKARQNKEEETSKAFWRTYNDCKSVILNAAQEVDRGLPADSLHDLVVGLEAKHGAISNAYQEVRNIYHSAPPSEIRRTVDRVKGDIDRLVFKAQDKMA